MADAARRTFVPPQPGPSNLGEIISRSIAIFRAHPMAFIALAFVTALPIGLVSIAIDLAYTVPDDDLQRALATLIKVLPAVLLIPISGAATAVAVIDCVNGKTPRVSHALEMVGEHFGILAAVVLISTIGFVLGIFALVVPGVILLVIWLFAPYGAVVEGLGFGASFRRSRKLVKGGFWPVLGVYIVVQIGAALIQAVLALILSLPALGVDGNSATITLGIATMAAATLAQPLALIGVALMYLDRRVRDEGAWPVPARGSQAT